MKTLLLLPLTLLYIAILLIFFTFLRGDYQKSSGNIWGLIVLIFLFVPYCYVVTYYPFWGAFMLIDLFTGLLLVFCFFPEINAFMENYKSRRIQAILERISLD